MYKSEWPNSVYSGKTYTHCDKFSYAKANNCKNIT